MNVLLKSHSQMSELERKRTLSESSEEEAEAAKVPRLSAEVGLASISGVTERSDSDSDSGRHLKLSIDQQTNQLI